MIYKLRPGIVRLNICGQDLLTATRQLWEEFPAVRPVPALWGFCCGMMSQGKTSEDVMRIVGKLYGKPADDFRAKFEPVFEELYQLGYLIPDESEL